VAAAATPSPSPRDAQIARLKAEVAKLEEALSLYERRERLEEEIKRFNAGSDHFLGSVLNAVCAEFSISSRLILSAARPDYIATPRMIGMHLSYSMARELGIRMSYSAIGHFYGLRDHGTAIHAFRTITDRCETDANLRARVDRIRAAIRNT
jgi:chromosomal replication initiator protein